MLYKTELFHAIEDVISAQLYQLYKDKDTEINQPKS